MTPDQAWWLGFGGVFLVVAAGVAWLKWRLWSIRREDRE
jgi:hypothetical protein